MTREEAITVLVALGFGLVLIAAGSWVIGGTGVGLIAYGSVLAGVSLWYQRSDEP